jgi:hypothetical protein
MPLLLSKAQARLAADAVRSLRYIYQKDIEGQSNPSVIEGKQKTVEKLNELLAIFEAHANHKPPTL